jgi:hypothetical protein
LLQKPGFHPSDSFAILIMADIIGEADSLLSRTRAALAPAQPVLRVLDDSDPLAKLAAKR